MLFYVDRPRILIIYTELSVIDCSRMIFATKIMEIDIQYGLGLGNQCGSCLKVKIITRNYVGLKCHIVHLGPSPTVQE